MTNPVTMTGNTCSDCYNEKVLHLKASDKICNDCVMLGTKTKPFLNWKAIPKGE